MITETTARHDTTHADDCDDCAKYDDDDAYDELIDISKPTKAG